MVRAFCFFFFFFFPFAILASFACDPPPAAPDPEPETETPAEIEAPVEEPARGANRRRTVYVPAYSHIDRGRRPTLFSITLSVRNVDPSSEVTLSAVDYYDTSGHRVRRYLSAPRRLGPLETAEFSVETLDEVGGSGANFLVYWNGPSDAHPLLTETVMIGQADTGYVAFTSRGVELDRPLPPSPAVPPASPPGGNPSVELPAANGSSPSSSSSSPD